MSIFSSLLFRYSLFPRQNLLRFSSNNGFNPDEFDEQALPVPKGSKDLPQEFLREKAMDIDKDRPRYIPDEGIELEHNMLQYDVDPGIFVPQYNVDPTNHFYVKRRKIDI